MPSAAPPTIPQHAFKGLDDWIEVFQAGTHTDSKGKVVTFTAADLDEMTANSDALGAAPAVVGHPQHDSPAYGWARQLRREGERLFAKFDDVHPAFKAAVEAGSYRNRSLSVYKDPHHGWRIRHVGWLGAAPPAIDGLQPLNFTADEPAELHEFASLDASAGWRMASAVDDMAAMARAWREHLIATQGQEVADQVAPEWRISGMTATAERLRQAADDDSTATATNRLFTHTDPGAPIMSLTQADLDRAVQEAEARVRTELGSQFSAQSTELLQLQGERQRERIGATLAGWKAAGYLLPAEEPGLAEFMAALDGGTAEAFEFTAAGANTPAKKTPAEFFAEFVARRGALVKITGGQAANTTDPAPALNNQSARQIADAALEFQAAEEKAGRSISIDVAVAHVTRQA